MLTGALSALFLVRLHLALGFASLCFACRCALSRYKWSLLGWSLEYRLKYFEKHWCYFLGFGAPAVALSVLFPRFLALGVYALAFPVFIILAIIANPRSHVPKKHRKSAVTVDAQGAALADPNPDPPVLLPQLPIFRGATWINWWLLQKLQTRNNKTTTTTTAATKATAASNAATTAASAVAAPHSSGALR